MVEDTIMIGGEIEGKVDKAFQHPHFTGISNSPCPTPHTAFTKYQTQHPQLDVYTHTQTHTHTHTHTQIHSITIYTLSPFNILIYNVN